MSDLFDVDAVLHGDDMDRVFQQIEDEGQENDPDPDAIKVKRVKFTIFDAVADSDLAARQEVIDLASILPGGPPMKAKRIQMHLREFVILHWPNPALKGKELGGGLLKERERTKEGIVERLQDYLTIRLLRSVKRDRITGEILLDPKTKKPKYMSIAGLEHYMLICMNLLKVAPYPPLLPTELLHGQTALKKHRETLVKMYNLKHHERRVTTLYPVDIRAMIELALESCEERWDMAVQTSCMLLTFMYLGARPGSVLKTKHYPNDYATWGDVKWRPSRDTDGVIQGFDVFFTLKSFKGFHSLKNLRITFQVKTVKSPKNAILDFGTMILAHGLRQGVFGERTREDIMSSDLFEFKCDPEFNEVPIFLARRSRSALSESPLDGDAANSMVKDLMQRLGIISDKSHSDTLYALRRGYATNVGQNLSRSAAVFHMGQRANTTMFEEHYDQSHLQQDMTEGILGVSEKSAKVVTPLTFTRAQDVAAPITTVELKDALKANPSYRHFYSKYQFLRQCDQFGSTAWQVVAPYKAAFHRGDLNAASIKILIAKYKSHLLRIARAIKSGIYKDAAERNQLASEELNYQTILARQEESDKPSELAQRLQAKLLEDEKEMLLNQDAEFDEKDVEDTYVIDGFEDDDLDDEEENGETRIGDGDGEDDSDDEDDTPVTATEDDSSTPTITDAERVRFNSLAEIFQGDLPNSTSQAAKTVPDIIPIVKTATEYKLDLFTTLTDLQDANSAGPDLCILCQSDVTASAKMKTQRHVRNSKEFQRHKITYHSAYQYANRWINHHKDNNGRFNCPFHVRDEDKQDGKDDEVIADERGEDKDDEDEPPRVCGMVYAAGVTHEVKKHCTNYHFDEMSKTLRQGINPDNIRAQQAVIAKNLEALWGRTYERKNAFRPRDPETYLVPGTLGILDFIAPDIMASNLGPSLLGTDNISFENDLLDQNMFDENGFLKRG
ncbi:hypothetical protein I204_05083 [Kwoniella mangroviensis CBS 8886]|nr:hypothetical protein I204_05083 [Kwoniella mangroviensis CBS 8886]